MTRATTDERKGVQRLQNILVVLLLLILAAVAARTVLINEPQKWRQTELEIAVSSFLDSLWLARTEWMRRGKPAEIALLNESREQQAKIMMNGQGWPSVEQGCLHLWQQLGGEIPTSALQAEASNESCLYKVNERAWFTYNSKLGQVIQK